MDPGQSSQQPMIEAIQKALKQCYERYHSLPRMFSGKANDISGAFINVSLLKREEVHQKEKQFFADVDRIQSHEALYQAHELMELKRLFDPMDASEKQPKKITIWGRAGIGKSVLCQYLATQWANDDVALLRNQFQAIFWLKLRDLTELDESEDADDILWQVLKKHCLAGRAARALKKESVLDWINGHTQQVLFILDGYDEIAGQIAKNTALKQLLDIVADFDYVLLTSRPATIDRLGSHAMHFDRELECMGFTNDNIEKFVTTYLKEEGQASEAPQLIHFLKSHPAIWGTAHVPVNAELITWLWANKRLQAPQGELTTLTALYSCMVESLCEINTGKCANLQQHYQGKSLAQWAEAFLCFLAYEAMEQQSILFQPDKIKHYISHFNTQNQLQLDAKVLLQACLDLGILQCIKESGKDILQRTHYFIHLSFQEFFAARYYYQELDVAENVALQRFKTHRYDARYQLVCWFIAGLYYQYYCKAQSKPAKKSAFDALTIFFARLQQEPQDWLLDSYLALIAHCIDECAADVTIPIIEELLNQQIEFLYLLVDKEHQHHNPYLGRASWQVAIQQSFHVLRSPLLANFIKTVSDFPLERFYFSAFIFKHWMLHASWDAVTFFKLISLFRKLIPDIFITTDLYELENIVYLHEILEKRPAWLSEEKNQLKEYLVNPPANPKYFKDIAYTYCMSELLLNERANLFTFITNSKLGLANKNCLLKALAKTLDEIDSQDFTDPEKLQLLNFITNTQIKLNIRCYLAYILAGEHNLNDDEKQLLLSIVGNKQIKLSKRIGLIERFTLCQGFTGSGRLGLIDLIGNLQIEPEIRRSLVDAINGYSDLNDIEKSKLIALICNAQIEQEIRCSLVDAISEYSDLNDNEKSKLIALISNTQIEPEIRSDLAYRITYTLIKYSHLTHHEKQHLFELLNLVDPIVSISIANALAYFPELNDIEKARLIRLISDTHFKLESRKSLAHALIRSSGLSGSERTQLIDIIANRQIEAEIRSKLATELARYPALTDPERRRLMAFITERQFGVKIQSKLAIAFAQRQDLSSDEKTGLIRLVLRSHLDIRIRISIVENLCKCESLINDEMLFLIDFTLIYANLFFCLDRDMPLTKEAYISRYHSFANTIQKFKSWGIFPSADTIKIAWNVKCRHQSLIESLLLHWFFIKPIDFKAAVAKSDTAIMSRFYPLLLRRENIQLIVDKDTQNVILSYGNQKIPFTGISPDGLLALMKQHTGVAIYNTPATFTPKSALASQFDTAGQPITNMLEPPMQGNSKMTTLDPINSAILKIDNNQDKSAAQLFSDLSKLPSFSWKNLLKTHIFDPDLSADQRQQNQALVQKIIDKRRELEEGIYLELVERLFGEHEKKASDRRYFYKQTPQDTGPNVSLTDVKMRYYTIQVTPRSRSASDSRQSPCLEIIIKAPGSRELTSDIDTTVEVKIHDRSWLADIQWPSSLTSISNDIAERDLEVALQAAVVDTFNQMNLEKFQQTSGQNRDANVYADGFLNQFAYLKLMDATDAEGKSIIELQKKKPKKVIYKEFQAQKHQLELAASLISLREYYALAHSDKERGSESGHSENSQWSKNFLTYFIQNPWKGNAAEFEAELRAVLGKVNALFHYKTTTLDKAQNQLKQDYFAACFPDKVAKGKFTTVEMNAYVTSHQSDYEAYCLNRLYAQHLWELAPCRQQVKDHYNYLLQLKLELEQLSREGQTQKIKLAKAQGKLDTLLKEEGVDQDELEAQRHFIEKCQQAVLKANQAFNKTATAYIQRLDNFQQRHYQQQLAQVKANLFADEAYINYAAPYHTVKFEQSQEDASINRRHIVMCSILQQIGFYLLHAEHYRHEGMSEGDILYRVAKYLSRIADMFFGDEKKHYNDQIFTSAELEHFAQGQDILKRLKINIADLGKMAFDERFFELLNMGTKLVKKVKKDEAIPIHEKGQKALEKYRAWYLEATDPDFEKYNANVKEQLIANVTQDALDVWLAIPSKSLIKAAQQIIRISYQAKVAAKSLDKAAPKTEEGQLICWGSLFQPVDLAVGQNKMKRPASSSPEGGKSSEEATLNPAKKPRLEEPDSDMGDLLLAQSSESASLASSSMTKSTMFHTGVAVPSSAGASHDKSNSVVIPHTTQNESTRGNFQ